MYSNLNPNVKSLVIIAIVMAIVAPIALHIGKEQEKQLSQQYNKSLTLYNQGDYVDAEAAIRTRMAMVGGDSFAPFHYLLGKCLLQEGRPSEALQEFQIAADEGNGYVSRVGGHFMGMRPDPVTERKANAAIAWMQQNPNWQPPAPGQAATTPGPPLDFGN